MKIVLSFIVALLVAAACSRAETTYHSQTVETSTTTVSISTETTTTSVSVSTTSLPESEAETLEQAHIPDIDWEEEKVSGGHPGVYLPRHCPGVGSDLIGDDGFVRYQSADSFECIPDHLLEVSMWAEVVRDEESSEDVYGVSQYLRIFPLMERVPTTGEFGLWGQWIGDA